MSRNSVEVLAFSESQRSKFNLNETGPRKFYNNQQYSKSSNKYETAAKSTKKFGTKTNSSLNLYQKNNKLDKKTVISDSKPAVNNSQSRTTNSSLIPQPASASKLNKNVEKKPTQARQSGTNIGHNKLSGESKKNVRACNNPTKSSPLTTSNKEKQPTKSPSTSSSKDSLKIDDHVKTVDAKSGTGPHVESRLTSMISQGGTQDNHLERNGVGVGQHHQHQSLEKTLSDQILMGRIPPKAKFRADDEISIADSEAADGDTIDSPTPAAASNYNNGDKTCSPGAKMFSSGKDQVTPSKPDKAPNKAKNTIDPYPPSHASLMVAKCLEEGGGRFRDQKTNSLPLNSALVSFDPSESASKSTSLDKYYNKAEKPQVTKSTSEGFFQRLSNLRRSFNSHDQKRFAGKIRPHLTDSNSPFFQGITHNIKRPNSSNNNNNNINEGRHHKGHHSLQLVLSPVIQSYKPPTRKYQCQRALPVKKQDKDDEDTRLRRSFSFSDAHVIATCVRDNDVGVITDLYPAFLSSEAVYNVIDRSKLLKNECSSKDSNKSRKLHMISKVVKDTNASEQTLIEASVKDDHENDTNDAREASMLLDAGSNVTLTASIVDINKLPGE